MKKRTQLTKIILLLAVLLTFGAARVQAQGQMIGINVLLNQPITTSILQDLGTHGQVLDVISQINGVILRAQRSELSTIQALARDGFEPAEDMGTGHFRSRNRGHERNSWISIQSVGPAAPCCLQRSSTKSNGYPRQNIRRTQLLLVFRSNACAPVFD